MAIKLQFPLLTAFAVIFALALAAQKPVENKLIEPGITAQTSQLQCRIPLKNQLDEPSRIISGKIVDAKSLKPVSYCQVSIKGTPYKAFCGRDGVFLIKIPIDKMNNLQAQQFSSIPAVYFLSIQYKTSNS